MSAKDVGLVLAAVGDTPGWGVEVTGTTARITGPGGTLIHSPTKTYGRGLQNLLASLRRAGWTGPTGHTKPARAARPTVEDRAPSGTPGVDELLLTDGSIAYGCPDPSCTRLALPTLTDAETHRDAHTPPPSEEPVTSPTPADVARLNGSTPPAPPTDEDLRDMLRRAARTVETVAAALDARPDQTEKVADLERQLSAERARNEELREQITRMQSAARLLMGGAG